MTHVAPVRVRIFCDGKPVTARLTGPGKAVCEGCGHELRRVIIDARTTVQQANDRSVRRV